MRPAPWPSQTRSHRQSSAISLMLRLGWTAELVRTFVLCGTPGLLPDAKAETPVHPSRFRNSFPFWPKEKLAECSHLSASFV